MCCNPRVLFADMDDCTGIMGGEGNIFMYKELMTSHPVDQKFLCYCIGYRSGQSTSSTRFQAVSIIYCKINCLIPPLPYNYSKDIT